MEAICEFKKLATVVPPEPTRPERRLRYRLAGGSWVSALVWVGGTQLESDLRSLPSARLGTVTTMAACRPNAEEGTGRERCFSPNGGRFQDFRNEKMKFIETSKWQDFLEMSIFLKIWNRDY